MDVPGPSTPTASQQLLADVSRKERVVRDLIAGRVSLFEAAVRFGGPPDVGDRAESVCRSVIGWVHLALRDRPERADLVAGRLEHELLRSCDRFDRLSGPLRLG